MKTLDRLVYTSDPVPAGIEYAAGDAAAQCREDS